MFTLIIGAMLFGTSIHREQTMGLAAGFIGSFLLSFVGSGGDFGSFNFYALFVVAATICYGFSSNVVKKYLFYAKPGQYRNSNQEIKRGIGNAPSKTRRKTGPGPVHPKQN